MIGVHPAWLPASAFRAIGSRRTRVLGEGPVVATVRGAATRRERRRLLVGHAERAHLALFDESDGLTLRREHELHAAGDEIDERRKDGLGSKRKPTGQFLEVCLVQLHDHKPTAPNIL